MATINSGSTSTGSTEDKLDEIIALLGGTGSSVTVNSGRKVVAVTNTAIAIGSDPCKTVFITALTTNGDVVVWGDAAIVYTAGSRQGAVLYPGDKATVAVDDLGDIFINGLAASGVSFTYTS